MILHAEHRALCVPQSFNSSVVQVQVSDLNVLGKRRGLHREPVILTRDLDLASADLLDRMVPAPMSKLEFVSAAAHRQR